MIKLTEVLSEIKVITRPDHFDFEDYDDTSINGPGMEMAIDDLIDDVSVEIKKNIPDDKYLRLEAKREIASLWIEKIRWWMKNN